MAEKDRTIMSQSVSSRLYVINRRRRLTVSRPMSHFEKSLAELGVSVTHAYSPQAKGWVEHLYGTLQNLIVKVMRLVGGASIADANALLDG